VRYIGFGDRLPTLIYKLLCTKLLLLLHGIIKKVDILR
jgi:hypothetical protein